MGDCYDVCHEENDEGPCKCGGPSKPKSAITREEWLAALTAALPADDDPDAMTSSELAVMLDISTRHARERLTRLVKEGKARKVSKVLDRGAAGRIRVPAYQLVK